MKNITHIYKPFVSGEKNKFEKTRESKAIEILEKEFQTKDVKTIKDPKQQRLGIDFIVNGDTTIDLKVFERSYWNQETHLGFEIYHEYLRPDNQAKLDCGNEITLGWAMNKDSQTDYWLYLYPNDTHYFMAPNFIKPKLDSLFSSKEEMIKFMNELPRASQIQNDKDRAEKFCVGITNIDGHKKTYSLYIPISRLLSCINITFLAPRYS